jgi:hypothetical protein
MRQTGFINLMIFLSVFVSSITFFRDPFEGYFHYIIFLLLFPVFLLKFGLPKKIIGSIFILFVVGVLEIFLGNNTWPLFLKIFLGFVLSVSFYGYVLDYFKFDTQKIFSFYIKGAIIVSYIGLFQFVFFYLSFTPGYNYSWLFNKWGLISGGFGIRVNSIFSEPAQCAIVLGPACFVAIYNLIPRNKKYLLTKFQSVLIILVTFLTTSSTGYIGLLFILLFLLYNYGKISYFFLGVPFIILVSFLLYNNVPDFKSRIDTSLGLWVDGDFRIQNINSSSFIIYNNYHIAQENFLSNPFTGTGLGSHPIAFDKYSLTNRSDIIDLQFNKADGNSLLIRLISETGILGVVFIFVFMRRFYVRRDPFNVDATFWIISNSVLIIIILFLLRQGNYFLNAFPLFMWIYYYARKNHLEQIKRAEEEALRLDESNETESTDSIH